MGAEKLLLINRQDLNEIIEHSLQDDPNECCGILGGKGNKVMKVYRATNTENSPYRYKMDPIDQLQADKDCDLNDWEFVAFYHSHTHSPAYPSATDVRMAIQNEWLTVQYMIVSLMDKSKPIARAFTIDSDGEIVEGNIEILDK